MSEDIEFTYGRFIQPDGTTLGTVAANGPDGFLVQCHYSREVKSEEIGLPANIDLKSPPYTIRAAVYKAVQEVRQKRRTAAEFDVRHALSSHKHAIEYDPTDA